MFEKIDNNIYSSPRDIYIERLEKNLRKSFEDRAVNIRRARKGYPGRA